MNGKAIVIGFTPGEMEMLREALRIPAFGVPEDCKECLVSEIFERAETLNGPSDWHQRKFVIMDGVDNETIKHVISSVKSLRLGRVIFATTTENSLGWKLKDLLEELMAEDEYFQAMRWARKEAKKKTGPFLDIGKG
ncbi:DUF3783 domain-containing protein [Thermococcus celer]|uniref:DUF3783 domain-containing protein n=1 Tax=Thermococcus celer Vu 13 = JCM 8558 TaxID=1293037 RepID=A0A218P268_THECE|nr:DUF3783 domain-containing protein [Thermococcus celer]ASI99019.1 hypothetical protein A3L02_05295 [Thermococcus celer Vu 13 = JCM 8558]